MNDQLIVGLALAFFGSGGIVSVIRILRKWRPAKGEGVITLAQGALTVQETVVENTQRERDYWKTEALKTREENDRLRREIERLESQLSAARAQLEHVQADLSALRRGLPPKP